MAGNDNGISQLLANDPDLEGPSNQATPPPTTTPNAPPQSGGRLKRMLSNFAEGFGESASRYAGIPTEYDKQQQAFKNQLATRQQAVSELNAKTLSQFRDASEELKKQQAQGTLITPEIAQALGNPGLAGQNAPKALIDAFSKMGVAKTNAGAKTDAAQITATGAQNVANTNAKSKLDVLKGTQSFQTWKTQQDNQTKLAVAQLTANKAPAAMLQTAAFAQSGISRLDDAEQAFNDLTSRGVLGSVDDNKLEDWLFGKGLVDPNLPAKDREEIGRMRAAMEFTSSAALRAHTGKTSKEIYDSFKHLLGLGQGQDALRGAFGETRSMLGDYATGATNEAIGKLRGQAGNSGGGGNAIEYVRGADGKLHKK